MTKVRCPDCGEMVELPQGVRSGDLVECPNCAGHVLRVREEGDAWAATLAHRVSCPDCEGLLTLPEGAEAGDLVECCGRGYRLSFEYGAFAAAAL
jgi:DNA-directed RNA polymerase subunit RPC12/RpoP